MQIEEGKYYRAANGDRLGPANVAYGGRFEFSGPHTHCHGADGKYIGHDRDLDLVAEWTEGPVRTETVTKRRIVPGVYGRLRVFEGVDGIAYGLTGDCYLSATELDDLAMVASQLAEALRDDMD